MVEMINTRINGKWNLLLPEHRAHRQEWITGWERERLDAEYESITNAKISSLEARPVVYCVGAEEGDLCSLYCQWGADVVLIEPNPKVWSNIRAIFQANNYENNVLGSFVGFASNIIAEPTKNIEGSYSLNDALLTNKTWPPSAYADIISSHGFRQLAQETDSTPQITLDKLSEVMGRPDVITIDVEGAELSVLQGTEHILTYYRPTVFVSIHEEFLGFWWKQTPQDVYDFMAGHGYVSEWLADDHETHVKFTSEEYV